MSFLPLALARKAGAATLAALLLGAAPAALMAPKTHKFAAKRAHRLGGASGPPLPQESTISGRLKNHALNPTLC